MTHEEAIKTARELLALRASYLAANTRLDHIWDAMLRAGAMARARGIECVEAPSHDPRFKTLLYPPRAHTRTREGWGVSSDPGAPENNHGPFGDLVARLWMRFEARSEEATRARLALERATSKVEPLELLEAILDP